MSLAQKGYGTRKGKIGGVALVFQKLGGNNYKEKFLRGWRILYRMRPNNRGDLLRDLHRRHENSKVGFNSAQLEVGSLQSLGARGLTVCPSATNIRPKKRKGRATAGKSRSPPKTTDRESAGDQGSTEAKGGSFTLREFAHRGKVKTKTTEPPDREGGGRGDPQGKLSPFQSDLSL